MSTQEKVLVSGHGYEDANIMFLGGHPLSDDIRSGVALSGSQEYRLNDFLKRHRLNIRNTYRTLFIKEHLSYAGTNTKKQREALQTIDLFGYENQLLDEIKQINPNVIVPLDDLALGVVYPYIKTAKRPNKRKFWVYCYRGSILPLRDEWQKQLDSPIKIIPIIGPQLQYADYQTRAYTQNDFERIIEESQNRNPAADYGIVWVCRSYTDFENYLDRMIAKQPTRITFDLEWTGGLMTAMSFCMDGWEAISIPWDDKDMSDADKALIWMRVAKILNSTIEKNNQNIKEDWKILERHGFNVCNVRSDTMLKGALLYPELPKGLDFYTSIHTKIQYYKDEGSGYDPKRHGKDGFYLYNAKDSLAAHIISTEQDKQLEEDGLKEFYDKEIAPSILIYKNMDLAGIKVDPQERKKLLSKYNTLFDSNEWILKNIVGDNEFNARSWQQVGKLIYEDLKFPVRKKTNENGTISYKTDKNTLDDLLIHYGKATQSGEIGYNILSRIIMCRKLAKVIEYISTPLHPDDTFRGSFNLGGTETGRTSCGKTLDVGFREILTKGKKSSIRLGRSLQTISKHGFTVDEDVFEDWGDGEIANDIRKMFVPRRGYCFIEGDGAGAEARVVFVLANDFDGLAAMDQKPKIHAKTAGAIFGIDPSTITSKGPSIPKIGITYYDLGKRIRHAGNYMMQAFRLAQMTHLPYKFCEDALIKFHMNDPKIQSVFHKEIEEQVRTYKRLKTPFGRVRDFFNQWSNELLKEAVAYIPQSTIGDLTKFSMWRIVDELPGYMKQYHFLVEQHDSILAEVKTDFGDKYLETFKRIYERPVDFNNCSLSRDFQLVVPAELFVGFCNWDNMQEIKL